MRVAERAAVRKADRSSIGLLRPGTYLPAGFLANVLALLSFFLLIYLSLTLFSLFTELRTVARAELPGASPARGLALNLIGAVLAATARNAAKGLWDARLGFLLLGLLGAAMAWVHQAGVRRYRERAWLISFAGTMLLIAVPLVSWAYVVSAGLGGWLLEMPELYLWQDLVVGSTLTQVAVSLIIAPLIAYPVWATWRWWYVRLVGWLAPTAQQPGPTVSSAPSALEEHRAQTARLRELREAQQPAGRAAEAEALPAEDVTAPADALIGTLALRAHLVGPLAVLLAVCLALLLVASYWSDGPPSVQHGLSFLHTDARAHEWFAVDVGSQADMIRAVNTKGAGIVSVYVSPTTDYGDAVAGVSDWSFEWHEDNLLENPSVTVPLTGLEPGQYYLHFVQESGWGYYEYTIGRDAGTLEALVTLASGLLLVSSVILALALIVLVVARRLASTL